MLHRLLARRLGQPALHNYRSKVLGFSLSHRRGQSGRSEDAVAEQRVQRRLAATLR